MTATHLSPDLCFLFPSCQSLHKGLIKSHGFIHLKDFTLTITLVIVGLISMQYHCISYFNGQTRLIMSNISCLFFFLLAFLSNISPPTPTFFFFLLSSGKVSQLKVPIHHTKLSCTFLTKCTEQMESGNFGAYIFASMTFILSPEESLFLHNNVSGNTTS